VHQLSHVWCLLLGLLSLPVIRMMFWQDLEFLQNDSDMNEFDTNMVPDSDISQKTTT